MRHAGTLAALVLAAASALPAQAPSLAGTWTLDTAASGRGRGNFAGYSIATRLVVTQSPTEVAIETNTGTAGQAQTTTYVLDGASHPVPGPLGWNTSATATLADGVLTVRILRTIDGPEGLLKFDVTDTYKADGPTLTLTRAQGSRVITLIYRR